MTARKPSDPFRYDAFPPGEYNAGQTLSNQRALWDRLSPDERAEWALAEPEQARLASGETFLVGGSAMPKARAEGRPRWGVPPLHMPGLGAPEKEDR